MFDPTTKEDSWPHFRGWSVQLKGMFIPSSFKRCTVLIESVFKKTKVFYCAFLDRGVFVFLFFFFHGKVFLVLFHQNVFCFFVFFYNDGKNYCFHSNLSQFPCSSKFFCLPSLSILAHIYIIITFVILYHYCNIKCGKEA